jgi:hypothetical protein
MLRVGSILFAPLFAGTQGFAIDTFLFSPIHLPGNQSLADAAFFSSSSIQADNILTRKNFVFYRQHKRKDIHYI